MDMHKKLAPLTVSLMLCGVMQPLHAEAGSSDTASVATVVTAKSFRITGSKAFSEAELLKLVSPALGKTLSATDLGELANRITGHYRRHGYMRAHAVIPAQSFADGLVRFMVTLSPNGESVKAARDNRTDFFPIPAQTPDSGNPVEMLLARVTWWMDRDRPDLARESLDKLFVVAPNHPDGLAMLAKSEAKAYRLDAARLALNTLKRIRPNHPDIAGIEAAIRLNGRDKDKLRHARQLAQQSRLPEHFDQLGKAVAAFRELYLDNSSDGDLALEYWQLVADTERGWIAARDGLTRLVRENPDNLRYRLALAEHETSRLPLKRQALQFIIEMTKVPTYSQQARRSWRRALMRLGNSPAHLPLLREYLVFEPGDSAMRAKLDGIVRSQAARRKLLADPNYQAKIKGSALLAQGDLVAAEPLLQQALQARPKDADLNGEMGLLRMRQGRHEQAREYFTRALQLTRGKSSKWRSLIQTAQFWQLMREAGDARDAGDLSLAENKLYAARKLDPREPNMIAALARIRADRGQYAAAKSGYRQALSIEPTNSSALRGLLSLYRQQGRDAEFGQMIAALSPGQRASLGTTLNRMQAGLLQQQAEQLFAQGRDGQAIALLEQAVQVDADDPWLRFSLAKRYARRGNAAKGQMLFDDFLGRHPDDPDALYALAQYQSNLDDTDQALQTLAKIPPAQRSENMALLAQRLRVSRLRQQARTLAQTGRQQAAGQMLGEAGAASAGNEELVLAVALDWVTLGDARQGRALFEQTRSTPPSLNWQLRYADFLAATGEDAALREQLTLLDRLSGLSPAEQAALNQLRLSVAIRTADARIAAGRPAAAHQTLAPLLAANPDDPALLLADARAYRAEQQWAAAQANYLHVLQLDSANREARNGLVESLLALQDRTTALRHLDAWLADSTAGNLSDRLQLAGVLIEIEEYARADELLDPLLAAYPHHPRVLAYAAEIARRSGRTDEEIDYLRRALAVEQTERDLSALPQGETQIAAQRLSATPLTLADLDEFGNPRKIHRNWEEKQLAARIDRRSRWLSSAIDIRERGGTSGLSQYHSVEIPLEYRTPWDANSEVVVRADWVKLNAGSADPGNTEFGSQLLCQPSCPTGLSLQSSQSLSFHLGYERGDLHADIGVTPLNFPVSNIVGGISRDGNFGKLSYTLELSRRPVTGSLLSFAGTKDPRTGTVWGGVVATGARLGLSLDQGGKFGGWASAGLYNLTGRNVLGNQRLQLMAGGHWRILNEENRLLSLGLTGMYWQHSENAGEYTFGHGGYYSPQTYRSLSLPLTYGQRYPRFSYIVRGAVSVSQSQTQAAPYFPTDSTMQAQAVALTPTNFITPVYTGGGSNGTGYALKGAWEYQLAPKLFVGGELSLDRSDNYSPNRMLFYLRYSLDRPGAQPVFFPPEPVEPSSQF